MEGTFLNVPHQQVVEVITARLPQMAGERHRSGVPGRAILAGAHRAAHNLRQAW